MSCYFFVRQFSGTCSATCHRLAHLRPPKGVLSFIMSEKLLTTDAVSNDTSLQHNYAITASDRQIGSTIAEQRRLMRKTPKQPANPCTLKVAILGSPNAGKSTLGNRLLGWKFAPVSEKVHTTRRKTIGILTEGNAQIVLLDTPGMIQRHVVKRHFLEGSLLIDPHSSLFEADLILAMVDVSTSWGRQRLDIEVLKALHFHSKKKSILVLNKVDLVKEKKKLLQTTRLLTGGVVGGTKSSFLKKEIEQQIDVMTLFKTETTDNCGNSDAQDSTGDSDQTTCEQPELQQVNENNWKEYHRRLQKIDRALFDGNVKGWQQFDKVFMISAKNGEGVWDIKEYLLNAAKPGDWEFPEELITPQPALELARQCVWEQCMNHVSKEIPYKLHVEVELWDIDDDGLLRTSFNIICKSSREMKNVLGKEGEIVKRIARDSKQALLNTFRRELSFKLSVRSTQAKDSLAR